MTWKSATLDDLEDYWQPVRSAILATAGLLLFVLLDSTQVKIYELLAWKICTAMQKLNVTYRLIHYDDGNMQ